MNSGYGPALRRFWWVLLIGGLAAVVVATLMVYTVSGFPPEFVERERPVYTSQARLFVTSGEAPYLRTAVPRSTPVPIGTGEQTATLVTNEAPDVSTLVDAANVYPLLIESDDVANLRTEMFGELPGVVEAQAIFSTATATRFQPSEIPVIVLFASAATPQGAVDLAGATSEAFRRWIVREQSRAGIDPKQRILIQELESPTPAAVIGGTGLGVPILAMLAVLTAFGAAAILLDRNFPRKEADDLDDSVDLAVDGLDTGAGIAETG